VVLATDTTAYSSRLAEALKFNKFDFHHPHFRFLMAPWVPRAPSFLRHGVRHRHLLCGAGCEALSLSLPLQGVRFSPSLSPFTHTPTFTVLLICPYRQLCLQVQHLCVVVMKPWASEAMTSPPRDRTSPPRDAFGATARLHCTGLRTWDFFLVGRVEWVELRVQNSVFRVSDQDVAPRNFLRYAIQHQHLLWCTIFLCGLRFIRFDTSFHSLGLSYSLGGRG